MPETLHPQCKRQPGSKLNSDGTCRACGASLGETCRPVGQTHVERVMQGSAVKVGMARGSVFK